MYKTVQIISGDAPPRTIVDSISDVKVNNTKFLFIAAGGLQEEIEYNTLFLKKAGKGADLWIVPKAKHTDAFSRYPKEYEKRIIDFFENSLLGNWN